MENLKRNALKSQVGIILFLLVFYSDEATFLWLGSFVRNNGYEINEVLKNRVASHTLPE